MQTNDIVIIKKDDTPPMRWKLGRIVEIHSGNDGKVRVVSLQTPSRTKICRSVAKLGRLPVEEDTLEVKNHSFQRGENVEAN